MTGKTRLRRDARKTPTPAVGLAHQQPGAGDAPFHQRAVQCRAGRGLEGPREVWLGEVQLARKVPKSYLAGQVHLEVVENAPKSLQPESNFCGSPRAEVCGSKINGLHPGLFDRKLVGSSSREEHSPEPERNRSESRRHLV